MFTADKHNIFEKKKAIWCIVTWQEETVQLLKKNKTYDTVTTRPNSAAPNAN